MAPNIRTFTLSVLPVDAQTPPLWYFFLRDRIIQMAARKLSIQNGNSLSGREANDPVFGATLSGDICFHQKASPHPREDDNFDSLSTPNFLFRSIQFARNRCLNKTIGFAGKRRPMPCDKKRVLNHVKMRRRVGIFCKESLLHKMNSSLWQSLTVTRVNDLKVVQALGERNVNCRVSNSTKKRSFIVDKNGRTIYRGGRGSFLLPGRETPIHLWTIWPRATEHTNQMMKLTKNTATSTSPLREERNLKRKSLKRPPLTRRKGFEDGGSNSIDS